MREKITQIRNLCLFIYALILVVFLPRKRKIEDPKKICIIQMAKLGDMVCTTPMFRAVKQKYPNSTLYVVGDSINKELLAGNHDVDEYVVFNRKNVFDVSKRLRSKNIDFCCVTNPDFVSLLIPIFAGIKSIVAPIVQGGVVNQTRTYKILRHFVINTPYSIGKYAPKERLKLLEPIGICSEDTKKYLNSSNESEKSMYDLFLSNNINEKDFIVGISPSAGNRVKQWPPERFAEVANYISEHCGVKIVVISGPNDGKEVDSMLNILNSDVETLNTAGELSIEELKALVSKLDLFISVDTGPIYIAEAFGVPTIDIIGPINEKEQPPIGVLHKVVVPKDREGPQLSVMNARIYNYDEARRQAESITVNMVVDVFKELYPLIKK